MPTTVVPSKASSDLIDSTPRYVLRGGLAGAQTNENFNSSGNGLADQNRRANVSKCHATLALMAQIQLHWEVEWRNFQIASRNSVPAGRPVVARAHYRRVTMDSSADLSLFREDALAFLGLLSSLYLRFDPPISSADGGASQPTHFQGLNIHALIIDNVDGEVLALEHNQIHAHQSPVEHAEQRALRMAIARMGAKRPRAPATTVEHYYRTQMFYNDGAEDADFLQRGATIYTSLEPCPMCATTILVCRVKRTVFLLQDTTYGGVWVSAKNQYYKKDKLTYGQLSLSGTSSPFILRVRDLHQTLSSPDYSWRRGFWEVSGD
jgi:tRNA(Arg) A34 adenosine deaminase TadA